MKIIILIALASAVLFSCAKDGVKTVGTENTNFSVTLLFTVDSCKVYRFYDDGYYRYFVTCNGQTIFDHTTSTGKTIIHHSEEISTAVK